MGQIAILRLDAGWYTSTKVRVSHLYESVVKAGFVIIDNYGAYDGCRKAVDEYAESLPSPVFLSYVNKDCRYWIKP